MAAIFRGQGCLKSNLQTRCHLALAMSRPSFVGITINYLEKSEKMWLRPYKMAAISWGQGCLRSYLRTRCPLPIEMSLPSFARIIRADLEKRAKMWFQTFKMTAIFQGQRRLRSNSQTRFPLPMALSLPSFVRITKKHWKKIVKVWFLKFFKWPPFRRILSNWAQILHCTPGPPKICVCKISSGSPQNWGPGQRFYYTFWILLRWRLQTNQTHRSHTSCGTW